MEAYRDPLYGRTKGADGRPSSKSGPVLSTPAAWTDGDRGRGVCFPGEGEGEDDKEEEREEMEEMGSINRSFFILGEGVGVV